MTAKHLNYYIKNSPFSAIDFNNAGGLNRSLYFAAIHQESIRKQTKVMNSKGEGLAK